MVWSRCGTAGKYGALVSSLISQDEEFCVNVYRRIVQKRSFVKGNEQSITSIATLGYNIAGSIVYDEEDLWYLLILKSNGSLEIWDHTLRIISKLDTGICHTHVERSFLITSLRSMQLYVNLRDDEVWCIPLERFQDPSRLNFAQQAPRVVHHTTYRIVAMELAWNWEESEHHEVETLSLLSQSRNTSSCLFEAMYKPDKVDRKQNDEWYFIRSFHFDALENFRIATRGKSLRPLATFKSITDLGFVVFTPVKTFMIPLEDFPVNKSSSTKNVYENDGIYSNICEIASLTPTIEVFSAVVLEELANSYSFTLMTNKNDKFTVKFKAVLDISSSDPFYDCSGFGIFREKCQSSAPITKLYSSTIHSVNRLVCYTNNLGVQYFESMKIAPNHLRARQCSVVVEPDIIFARYLNECLGLSLTIESHLRDECRIVLNYSGYLPSSDPGDEGRTMQLEVLYEGSGAIPIDTLRSKDGGIQWLDSHFVYSSDGSCFVRREEREAATVTKHEVYLNAIVSSTTTPKSVRLTYTSHISWSDTNKTLNISHLTKFNAVKCLRSKEIHDNCKITVIATERLIYIYDERAEEPSFLSYDLGVKNIQINDVMINYNKINCEVEIVISDDQGMVFIYKLTHIMTLEEKFDVSQEPVQLCEIGGSINFISYTRHRLLIFKKTHGGSYVPNLVSTDATFKKIVSCSDCVVAALTLDNTILRIKIGPYIEPKYCSQVVASVRGYSGKYITFRSSERFVVFYLNSDEGSWIYSIDLVEKRIKSSYELSSLDRNVTTTDIITIPYVNKPDKLGISVTGDIKISTRLMFDKCFLVALNTDKIEDAEAIDSLRNILLFSIDDSSGNLDMHTSIKTAHSINIFQNFYDFCFLACGSCIEIFVIKYYFKENRFVIQSCSNNLECRGFIVGMVHYPRIGQKNKVAKEKNNHKIRRTHLTSHNFREILIVLNLLSGVSYFIIDNIDKYLNFETNKMNILESDGPKFSDYISGAVTSFAWCTFMEVEYILMSDTRGYLVLISKDYQGTERFILRFLSGERVLSICATNRVTSVRYLMPEVIKQAPLFHVTTTEGGIFTLSVSPSKAEINRGSQTGNIEEIMDRQSQLIDVEVRGNVKFIDHNALDYTVTSSE